MVWMVAVSVPVMGTTRVSATGSSLITPRVTVTSNGSSRPERKMVRRIVVPASPRICATASGGSGPVLIATSVSGTLLPLNAQTRHRALWDHPALTLAVIARIHWQALRLWIKRTPFFRQPAPPADFVTAGTTQT